MRNITAAALMLVLASTVSCGKKSSATDNPSEAAITVPMTGTWSGTGSTITDGGAPDSCSVVTVTLAFTANTVTISNLNLTCTGGTLNQSPVTFDTTGGQLTYQGVASGTITDSAIHATYNDSTGSGDMQFTLQDPTHVNYSETITGNGHTLTLSGALVHQ